jgi:hypothetical protein
MIRQIHRSLHEQLALSPPIASKVITLGNFYLLPQ